MSVDGIRFRFRDEGAIGGNDVTTTAGDPVPGFPLGQTTGILTVIVEAGDTVTLWAAAASPLTAFDYLFVMAGEYPAVDALADDGTTPDLVGLLTLTANVGAGDEKTWIEPLRSALPYRRYSNVAYDAADAASVVGAVSYENDTDDDVTVRFLLGRA